MSMEAKIKLLTEHYSVDDLLEQNDIEAQVVLAWLVDEGLIDVEEYFYTDVDEECLIDEE